MPVDAPASKILIVDDEPDIVAYLEHLLAGLGYATLSAGNGKEALEKAAAESPDLILMDVTMPVMDGITACAALKGKDETRLTPIVIMTALGSMEDRVRGIEAGADDFLIKPVDNRELMARIQTALKLKHAVDRKLRELHRIRDHFSKFVPEAVRQLIAANPEEPALAKRERDVSILFLDITGYARLSEELRPEALNALVERYFSTFLDRIQAAAGDITETAGDGFMAVFQEGAAETHARRAAETALGLLAVTEALNQRAPHRPLGIHMGINSGSAWVGSTRFEGSRGTRWTFTASGPVTNLAARLAEVARDGEILVGSETARRFGDGYRIEKVTRGRLKNISDDVEHYRLVGPADPR